MRQLIAGVGFVGKHVAQLFPEAEKYDIKTHPKIPKGRFDFCHICTPTPANPDGSCDYESVRDVIRMVDANVFVIRSTIPPGVTDLLGGNCVFEPEYCASSSPYPAPLDDLRRHSFIILGGHWSRTRRVRELYQTVYPPTTRIIEMSALEAEITKYMENAFIATYVTFINEFNNIASAHKVDFTKVREGFLADPRMTPWWTYVTAERGWAGECLPKDMASICHSSIRSGYQPNFLLSVIENNRRHRNV